MKSSTTKPREQTWNRSVSSDYDFGRPFVDMLKDHHLYGDWLDVETEYEIKLDNSTFHWRLLVKKWESRALPYASLEITTRTSNSTNLIPVIREYEDYTDSAIDKGILKGSLSKLCGLADQVVSKMETYNLFTRNCQHFCNELLKTLGKDESPLTFSRDMTEESQDFDLLSIVLPNTKKKENSATVIHQVVKHSATAVPMQMPKLRTDDSEPCKISGSPVAILTVNDASTGAVASSRPSHEHLEALLEILAPLEDRWREIGHELALLPYTLNHNKGMRNMLKKYLEQPSRSWEQLVNAVSKFDQGAAQSILELAKEQLQLE